MALVWSVAEVTTLITLYGKYFKEFGDIKYPAKRKQLYAKIRMGLLEAGYDKDIDAIRKKLRSVKDCYIYYYQKKSTDGASWVHYAAMKKIFSKDAGHAGSGEDDDGKTKKDSHLPKIEDDAGANSVLSDEQIVVKEEIDDVTEEDSNTNVDPFIEMNKDSSKLSSASLAARERIHRYQRYWKASKTRKRDPEDSVHFKMSSWRQRDTNWDEVEPDNCKPHMGTTTNIINCLFCYKTIDGSSTSKQETCSVQKQLDDNGRVIFILKKLLGITKDELVSYLGGSDGCNPSTWIGICTSCNILISEAEKILEKINSLERELMNLREQCEEKVQKSFKCTHTKSSIEDPCFTCISTSSHENFTVTNKVRQSVIARKFSNPHKVLKLLKRLEHPRPAMDDLVSLSSSWKGRTWAAAAKTDEYYGDDDDADLNRKQTAFINDDDDFRIVDEEVVDDYEKVVDEEDEGNEDGTASEVDFYESSGQFSDTDIEEDKVQPKRKRRNFSTPKSRGTRTTDDSKDREVLGGSFTCPICPNLPLRKPMNMQQFVHHLIFHREHPFQCVLCKGFLPLDAEKRSCHWNLVHSSEKSEISEEERYIFVNVTTSDVKIYNCGICEDYFNTAEQRDAHVLEQHSSSFEKIITCSDCSESFVNLFELKLHQALVHPTVAKQSCPVCVEKFRGSGGELDEVAFSNHVSNFHPSIKIHIIKLCKLCGFPFETNPRIPNINGKAFHLKTFHGHILGRVFKCSLCDFEDKGFYVHQKHLHDAHSKVVSKALLRNSSIEIGDMVSAFPRLRLRCTACFLDKEEGNANAIDTTKTIYFHCVAHLEEHLKEVHFLNLEFKQINSNTFRSWQSRAIRLKQLECSKIEEIRKKKNRFKKNKEPPPIAATETKNVIQSVIKDEVTFECPACPNLDKMDLDSFIVHILFHWRQPHRCTTCGVYLPNPQEVIDRHWKEFHENTAFAGERLELVNFDPGKVWCCADPNCEERFTTHNERDAHEKDTHNIAFDSAAECEVCNLHFRDVNDVRLHKALAHPECAELCCTYCNASFGVVSKEGPNFRHARYLLDHLNAKECYDPREPRRNILENCTLCGEVFIMPYLLVKHLRESHGIMKEKLFTCVICHQEFNLREIKRHTYDVHGPRPICEICGITINWTKGLKHHKYRVHGILEPGLKVQKCPVEGCKYQATRSAHLKQHMAQVHGTKTRNHSCQYCGRTFSCSKNLKRHEEIHSNADTRPYVCEVCGAGFAVRNYLYTHVRVNHHRNWNYKYKYKNRTRK